MIHMGLMYTKIGFLLFLYVIATINSYTAFMTSSPGKFCMEMAIMFVSGFLLLFLIMYLCRNRQSFPKGLFGEYDAEHVRIYRYNIWFNCVMFGIVSVLFYLFAEFSGMNAVGFTITPKQPPPPATTLDPHDDVNTQKIIVLEKRLEIQILGAIVVASVMIALCGFYYLGSYSLGIYNVMTVIQSNDVLSEKFREFRKSHHTPTTNKDTLWYKWFGDTSSYMPSTFQNTGSLMGEALIFGFFFNVMYLVVAADRNAKSETKEKSFWMETNVYDVIAPTVVFAFAYVFLITSGAMDMFMCEVPPAPTGR